MNRFWQNEKASVSLFLVIVLASVFLFHAVLIEFVRIHAAKTQTEQAMRTGAQSVMSGYDPVLHQYGLFALDVSRDAEAVLEEILKRNLASTPNSASFVSPIYEPGSAQIKFQQNLANKEKLLEQILEEMKYRAPVAIILDISDKFSKTDLQDEMAETARIAMTQQRMGQLFDEREQALDQVWLQLKKLIGPAGTIENMTKDYTAQLEEIYHLADEIGLRTADQVRQQINRLEERIQRLQESLRHAEELGDILYYQGQIQLLVRERSDLRSMLRLITEYMSRVLAMKRSIGNDLTRLNARQEELLQALETAKERNRQLYQLVSGQAEQDDKEITTPVPVLGAEYFLEFETKLGKVISLLHGFDAIVHPEQLITGRDFVNTYEKLLTSLHTFHNNAKDWYAVQWVAEQERQARNERIDREEANHKQELLQTLKRLKEVVYDCSNSDEAYHERLEGLERKYEQYNSLPQSEAEPGRDTPNIEDVKHWQNQAIHLLERFKTLMYGVRNEWFMYEYALTYFNHRAYNAMSQKSGFKPAEAGMADPSRHRLKDYEAEYLLYGFHSCAANQSAVFTELFALRLGIRMMEQLTDPEKTAARSGLPWVTLLWAAAEGGKQAFQDVQQLLKGEEVAVSSKLPAAMTLNYKDYLRLFMILHANEEAFLIRLQALLELNTGIGLEKRAIDIEVEGTARLPVWFLPAVNQPSERGWKAIPIRRSIYFSY